MQRTTATSGPVVGLLAGLLTLSTVTAAPPASAVSDAARTYARQAFVATNNVRAAHDRVRLAHGACVQKHARRQARRMANQRRIFHQDMYRVLRDCHMNFVGENVAAGFPDGRSVVRRGWMRSPDHRRNILEPRFRRMGVAARRGDDGRWYVSQVFGRHP